MRLTIIVVINQKNLIKSFRCFSKNGNFNVSSPGSIFGGIKAIFCLAPGMAMPKKEINGLL